MRTRNETLFKWTLYGAAALLCFLVQGAFLQRISLWGVIPFLFPVIAAVGASYEAPVPGTIFALVIGVLCDLLLPELFPCFYTLAFPLVGLAATLISQSLLPAGIICSLAVSALAFLITDLGRCLLLWINGTPAWSAGAFLMLRELCITLPLVLPVTLLFRMVHRRTHLDD